MLLIMLPRNENAETKTKAMHKFQAAVDDPLTVVLIVYGEREDTDRMLEVGTDAATVKADIRRVLWVRDPSVMSAAQKKKYLPKNHSTHPVVSIGLDDKRAMELTRAKAKVTAYVEQAFHDAESQGGNS